MTISHLRKRLSEQIQQSREEVHKKMEKFLNKKYKFEQADEKFNDYLSGIGETVWSPVFWAFHDSQWFQA